MNDPSPAAPTKPDLDVVELLVRNWSRLLILAVLGTAAGIVYAFLAPSWYRASLTVVPSQGSKDASALMLAAKLPSLDLTSTDSKRIEAVLMSASVADQVIDKFKLDQRYGVAHREEARATLWGLCTTSVDRKSGIVTLTCEDQDPKMAMEIAAAFGDFGNQVFGRVSASSAREEAQFLETQVTKARADVDDASRKLREFQEAHKIVDLPEQSKAVISAMASLEGDLVSKQLELSYLTSFSSRTESSVQQLQQQIAIMESKLKQLETPSGAAPAGTGSGSSGNATFFPGAMNVPELRFELEQLLRDQKIKETVFSLMTQRYELAKVDAARDTDTFQILDHPTLPTMRSRPIRRHVALAGLFAGLAAGCAWILVPAVWRRRFPRAR